MSSTTLPVCPKTGSTSPSLTVHLCLHTAPGNRECALHGRRGAGDGFGHIAFVGGDLTSQGFGGALDLLGLDAHRGQFPQQAAGRGEAKSDAASPTIRSTPGDSDVACKPNVRSRGQMPARQASQ